jgi:hypothetical protein
MFCSVSDRTHFFLYRLSHLRERFPLALYWQSEAIKFGPKLCDGKGGVVRIVQTAISVSERSSRKGAIIGTRSLRAIERRGWRVNSSYSSCARAEVLG